MMLGALEEGIGVTLTSSCEACLQLPHCWSAPAFRTAMANSNNKTSSHIGIVLEGREMNVRRKRKAKH